MARILITIKECDHSKKTVSIDRATKSADLATMMDTADTTK
jgi:hypothetical protein